MSTSRRPSGVSATLGAQQGSFAMRSYNTFRPSYESLSSEYSVATQQAIDRSTSQSRRAAPPRPAQQVHDEYQQGSTVPVYAPRDNASRLRRPFDSEIVEARLGAQRQATTQRASPVSSMSLEIVSTAVSSDASDRSLEQALASLNGEAAPAQYSPPHGMTAEQFRAAYGTQASQLPSRPVIKRKPVPAATGAEVIHSLNRGVFPETSFNVYDGDAVLIPDSQHVPYASNHPQRQRRPSFSSSVSNGLKQLGRKISSKVRRGSDAGRSNIAQVPGSFSYDQRSYPTGPMAVNDAVPVADAQRTSGGHTDDQSRGRRHDRHYPNALRPQSKQPTPVRAAPAPVAPPPQVQRAANPEHHRLRRVRRLPNRDTTFGDIIDAANLPSSDSDSEHDQADEASFDTARILAVRTPPADNDGFVHVDAPIMPWSSRKAGNQANVEGASLKKDTNKSLPDPPRAPRASRNTTYSPIGRMPNFADEAFDRPDDLANNANNQANGVPADAFTQAAEEAMRQRYQAVKNKPLPSPPSAPPPPRTTYDYGSMPMYAEDAFDRSIRSQISNADIRASQIPPAINQALEARHMFDRPRPGRTTFDMVDEEPQMVVDTMPRDGHTSWVATYRRDQDTVDSFSTRVPTAQYANPSKDLAAAWWANQNQMRYGGVPPSRRSSRRTQR